MSQAIPIFLVNAEDIRAYHGENQKWLDVSGFKGQAGTFCVVPDAQGSIAKILVGKPETLDTWTLGSLAQSLPAQTYYLADSFSAETATQLCLGWRLGQYQFTKYKQNAQQAAAELQLPENADQDYVRAAAEATFLVRDLVNTPVNDMRPAQLEDCAHILAETYEAKLMVIKGEDLLKQNYPLIHAVGRANDQVPRLIDLRWGEASSPKITLVGKGVCFDTGGLNIKSAASMKMMKKDMGGAAEIFGLAKLIMQMKVPVQLRVLVPAVENSISDNAMRPLDVMPSRRGITVEVGNTDAEGRLILADALWEACSESPDLVIDCATLTGAARVALGTELPAFFCNQADVASLLLKIGQQTDDPFWQLPLHQPYRALLESKVADISNISNGSYGGAITAALFLQEFVTPTTPWIHVDLMAWNLRSLPGRPEGGEAMGMRSLFELIRQWVK
ncbi:MAG: leucyl aminopeptidase family protein [Leptolyngbyaceae cyanobacterium SL_1_1]|nr:leucyl aminopeptidase family protein [Leptolyngbyaceae cyanobacterium RM1_1_2]NJO11618.1 leucyl aminopeptidase family protein [Leptolyngbyaceae cyanobacterium SL_1_1]